MSLSVPLELHSDQGTNFESAVFSEMCRALGISKTRTTAYNPKSDGMVERFNKTLINMVAVMTEPRRRQCDWDECLPYACFAYRCTPQESTGESPNMMMFGRELRLPVDLVVEGPAVEDKVATDFAQGLRQNLQEAHERPRECLRQSARHQKRTYDRKVHGQGLEEGQFVWLFNNARKKGRSPKLEFRWDGPFLVVKKLSDVTYRVQRKPGSKAFVVHGDRLKPYTGEALEAWGCQPKKVEVKLTEEVRGSESVDVNEVVCEDVSEGPGEGEEPPEALTGGPKSSEGEVVSSPSTTPRRYPRREHRLPVRYR